MNQTAINTGRREYQQTPGTDMRRIQTGWEIPTEYYSDQPYVVKLNDGTWLLTVTTGAGVEGSSGQHVISMRSVDKGKTWSKPIDVEPGDGPEASYAVLLKTDYGRVYCFYNHNSDDVREVKADNPPYLDGYCTRVDSLGHFVFKYTDDGGLTWSDKRYDVPMRLFEIDRENADKGKLLYFWNVGRPFVLNEDAYISLHKVGGFGDGFFTRSEGVLLKSENILTERNPEKIIFYTLPDGEVGLRAPLGGGSIAEEQSYVTLSDGSICVVYRTVDGHPAQSISRDAGHTFSSPEYRSYADGRLMKHPRAANFMWKCKNGKYLYWFHNHGGHDYEDRNPVWLCGGIEVETESGCNIVWSQPEVVLYDDDPMIRMSYPDFIEDNGKYYLTEAQKDIARTHEISEELLCGLWGQLEGGVKPAIDTALECEGAGTYKMPRLPEFTVRDTSSPDYRSISTRLGITLSMKLLESHLQPGNMILDTFAGGKGIRVIVGIDGELVLEFSDGCTGAVWHCDKLDSDRQLHDVTLIIDGGPRLIMCVADGVLQDGGMERQFGWGRFSPCLQNVNGGDLKVINAEKVKIFTRALRVSEALADQK